MPTQPDNVSPDKMPGPGIALQAGQPGDIATKVEMILNTPNPDCPDAPLILPAPDLYVHANIDFLDAYNAFEMKQRGLAEILTCDREHFARVPWVRFGNF